MNTYDENEKMISDVEFDDSILNDEFANVIRNGLDEAFDIDKISVSEELIAKTLNAINEIKTNEIKSNNPRTYENNTSEIKSVSEITPKAKSKRIWRQVAGVVAALVVVGVGIITIRGGLYQKSDKTMNDPDKVNSVAGVQMSESAAPSDKNDYNYSADSTASNVDAGYMESANSSLGINKEYTEMENAVESDIWSNEEFMANTAVQEAPTVEFDDGSYIDSDSIFNGDMVGVGEVTESCDTSDDISAPYNPDEYKYDEIIEYLDNTYDILNDVTDIDYESVIYEFSVRKLDEDTERVIWVYSDMVVVGKLLNGMRSGENEMLAQIVYRIEDSDAVLNTISSICEE